MDWNNWYIGFVKKTVFYIVSHERFAMGRGPHSATVVCVESLASAVRSSPAYAGYVHVAQPLDPALLVVRIKQAQCFA